VTGDLTGFLAARLDEDEGALEDPQWGDARGTCYECGTNQNRLRREVAAKRAILALHSFVYPTTYPEPSGQPTCNVCHCGTWDWEPCNWPCQTVRHLAAVYSGHPDYRQEWAP